MIEFIGQSFLRKWMLERNNFEYTNGLICLGNRSNEGFIKGVVGYDHWTGKSCVMHMVGNPGWLTKTFVWAAFDYPFNQAKCDVVFGRIPTDNMVSIELALRVGFHWDHTIPDVYPEGDEAVLCMYRSECKWLEINHGWKDKGPAAS